MDEWWAGGLPPLIVWIGGTYGQRAVLAQHGQHERGTAQNNNWLSKRTAI